MVYDRPRSVSGRFHGRTRWTQKFGAALRRLFADPNMAELLLYSGRASNEAALGNPLFVREDGHQQLSRLLTRTVARGPVGAGVDRGRQGKCAGGFDHKRLTLARPQYRHQFSAMLTMTRRCAEGLKRGVP